MAILNRFAVDLLIFTDAGSQLPLYGVAADSLLFTEILVSGQNNFSFRDGLPFFEQHNKQLRRVRSVTDTLTFNETYRRGAHGRADADFISFNEAYRVDLHYFPRSDTLAFTEVNVWLVSKGFADTLILTEVNSYTSIRQFVCTDTLSLTEGYNQFKPNGWMPAYTISTVTTPLVPIRFKRGASELDFRHYEFGNNEVVEFTRVNRRTRGGDLLIGPNTAETRTLNFVFNLCTQAQSDGLMKFFRDNLGKEVELRDHESIWWDGVVMNPDTQRVQTGRNTFSIAVQFEGVPQ